jgi:hypothetical protein
VISESRQNNPASDSYSVSLAGGRNSSVFQSIPIILAPFCGQDFQNIDGPLPLRQFQITLHVAIAY